MPRRSRCNQRLPHTRNHARAGEGLWLPAGGASDAPDALGPLLSRASGHELAPAMERRVLLLRNMNPYYDEAKKGGCGSSDSLVRPIACRSLTKQPQDAESFPNNTTHTITHATQFTTSTSADACQRLVPRTSSWCPGTPHTYTLTLTHNHTKHTVHYLDFRGRVSKASAKNFQLVPWDHNSGAVGSELSLQFGKRSGEEFVCDFGWPLNALQAFSLGE